MKICVFGAAARIWRPFGANGLELIVEAQSCTVD